MSRFIGSLSKDRRGGIEGLPLQLMIVILVATMGTAVIIGWMGNIDTPNGISDVETDREFIEYEVGDKQTSLTVTVYDQDKNPLPKATVLLTGVGVQNNSATAYLQTGEDGKASFNNLSMDFPGKKGFLTVNVSKPDYGEHNSTQILVIKKWSEQTE